MTSSIRDTTYQLRQGQIVALADETGWSLAVDPANDDAVKNLLALDTGQSLVLRPTVLIQNTDRLVLYVAKIPEIAYDLVEFAENPLIVIYEQGKNISQTLWTGSQVNGSTVAGSVAIRRSLSAEVQQLLGGFGRGVLTIPFESLLLPPTLDRLISVRFGTLPAQPKRPRIMELGVDGSVHFVRK